MPIPVPDVISLTQTAAEAALQAAGLVLGAVTQANSATVPSGSVSGVNPAAGTLVSPGSTVNLEVSTGAPSQVAVPYVVGFTKQAAEAALKSAGLVLGKQKRRPDNAVSPGGITSTDPRPGGLVSPGSAVAVEVSTGPERDWTQYIPMGLFTLLGAVVLGIIVYGIVGRNSAVFLSKLADKETARGLITFLIAIATVGIAIILAISTIVLEEGEEGDKRFDRGKQVLTILIGVLGTIVGFYFGSAPEGRSGQQQTSATQQAQTLEIITATLPVGAINAAYTSTLNATGGTPPLKWSVTPDLPTNLKLDSATGMISGTPLAARVSQPPFTFTVEDNATPQAKKTVQLSLEIR